MLLRTFLLRTTHASKWLGLWSRFKTIISPLLTRLCLKYRLLKVAHLERLETIPCRKVRTAYLKSTHLTTVRVCSCQHVIVLLARILSFIVVTLPENKQTNEIPQLSSPSKDVTSTFVHLCQQVCNTTHFIEIFCCSAECGWAVYNHPQVYFS